MSGLTLRDALRGLKEAIVDPISSDFRQGTDYFAENHPAAYAVAKATPIVQQGVGVAELIGGKPEGAVSLLPAIGPAYRIGSQIPRSVAAATRANGSRLQQGYQGLRQGVGADNVADIGEGFYTQTLQQTGNK